MSRLPSACLVVALAAALAAGCTSSSSSGNSTSAATTAQKSSPELAARYNTELAEGYMKEGRMDLAQQKLSLALKEAPRLALVHNELALYYERVGQDSEADREYQLSLKYAPGDPSTLNNYGAFLCREGKYRASLDYFTRAAANLDYNTPDAALANAGMCALKIPDKQLAQQYFQRALAINPDMSQALWQLGLMAFEQGNYSLANGYFTRLVDTQPDASAQVLWVAIETAWTLGDQDTAKRYGRVLLKRYPQSEEAKKFIQLISNGQ
jgi:type IV pilus assembly protein PilF